MKLTDLITKCDSGVDRFRIYINGILIADIVSFGMNEKETIFNDKFIVEAYNFQSGREENVVEIFLIDKVVEE